MTKNTNTIQATIHISNRETYDTLGTLLLTAPNIAVRVSKVVIVMVALPAKYRWDNFISFSVLYLLASVASSMK